MTYLLGAEHGKGNIRSQKEDILHRHGHFRIGHHNQVSKVREVERGDSKFCQECGQSL